MNDPYKHAANFIKIRPAVFRFDKKRAGIVRVRVRAGATRRAVGAANEKTAPTEVEAG